VGIVLSMRDSRISRNDGIDRRGFLKCMRWAGTGVISTLSGGVPVSRAFAKKAHPRAGNNAGEFSFVQISDSHMGFNKAANPDVSVTFEATVEKINALPQPPDFLLHTGDISHLSRAEQSDSVDQILKGASAKDVFFVPGEHDVLDDNGRSYLERYGKGAKGAGWYSFDKNGVHFVGLVNVMNLKAGGLGSLGREQLEWLDDDVCHLKSSTPIVVFAHIPLWSVYPDWGWGTEDSAQALGYLKKFGSVTVLNGHIHQTMQKVEGSVTFHTAMSTAFRTPTRQSRFTGAHAGSGRSIENLVGNYGGELCSQALFAGRRRFHACVTYKPLRPEAKSIKEQKGMKMRHILSLAVAVLVGSDFDVALGLSRVGRDWR
jgi:3',5'-cyclic-AMP phosphodiesterase